MTRFVIIVSATKIVGVVSVIGIVAVIGIKAIIGKVIYGSIGVEVVVTLLFQLLLFVCLFLQFPLFFLFFESFQIFVVLQLFCSLLDHNLLLDLYLLDAWHL